MKRIAVMGAGSLGTILGAYLTKAGLKVDLIDANREHVDALNKNGATVVGSVEMNVPVSALTPDRMAGIYDVVFYMAKQTYNEAAFQQLLPHVGKNSIIVACPNGLPEAAVAEVFGEGRTLGAPVCYAATMIGPGVSKLTSVDPEKMF